MDHRGGTSRNTPYKKVTDLQSISKCRASRREGQRASMVTLPVQAKERVANTGVLRGNQGALGALSSNSRFRHGCRGCCKSTTCTEFRERQMILARARVEQRPWRQVGVRMAEMLCEHIPLFHLEGVLVPYGLKAARGTHAVLLTARTPHKPDLAVDQEALAGGVRCVGTCYCIITVILLKY